jgi:serine/threonine protein kinase
MLDLLEVFVDPEGVHVVIEYLQGDALFDAILKRDHFSERDAADVMRQLLEFLAFSHAVGIVHRDIKPENLIIVADEDETAAAAAGEAKKAKSTTSSKGAEEGENDPDRPPPLLKVIDFGSAAFCEHGQRLHSKFGTVSVVGTHFRRLSFFCPRGGRRPGRTLTPFLFPPRNNPPK